MPVWSWSTTASSNGTADSTINFAEGQAPSSVNDSARALMAAQAKERDDLNGSITTGGSSTAYTVATNSVYDTLAHLGNAIIGFTVHTTSGASPTLNVDGLGAKQIRSATGINIPTGALISGTPYQVVYKNGATEFILLGYRDTFLNASVTGTFAVTGATTFTGAVTFNGGGDLSTGTYTGAATFSGNLIFSGIPTFSNVTAAAKLSGGTTGQRNGSPTAGDTRYNTSLNGLEYWNGTAWIVLGQAPTVQRLLSGTAATFTPTAGAVRFRIRMVGGGGGGGATTANAGTAGTASSFQVNSTGTAWTAALGGAGPTAGTGAAGPGGTGGTDGSTGTLVERAPGANGSRGLGQVNGLGGYGGSSAFGGGGDQVTNATNGVAAKTNTGSGGSSAGINSAANPPGGGGAGEYVEFWVTGMTTATYTVGAKGTGGAAGTNAGGDGAAGIILIEEFYS